MKTFFFTLLFVSLLGLSSCSEDFTEENQKESSEKTLKTSYQAPNGRWYDTNRNWKYGYSNNSFNGPSPADGTSIDAVACNNGHTYDGYFNNDTRTLGIPVYIKTQTGKYLKLNSDRKNVTLVNQKENSLLMQWLLVGTSHDFEWVSAINSDAGLYTYYVQAGNSQNEFKPYGGTKSEGLSGLNSNVIINEGEDWDFNFVPGSDGLYYIRSYRKYEYGKYENFQPPYLGYNGSLLEMRQEASRQTWQVEIAEECDLVSLNWSMAPEDVVKALPDYVQEITVSNQTSVNQSMTATFTQTATQTSSFSNSKSVGTNTSFNVGVSVLKIFSAGGSGSTTQTQTWQFGTTEQKQDTRSYSFPVNVPPYTTVVAKASVQMGKLNASYVATFRGRISGQKIDIRGRWEGVQAGMVSYELREVKTKQLLKKFEGIPQSEVKL